MRLDLIKGEHNCPKWTGRYKKSEGLNKSMPGYATPIPLAGTDWRYNHTLLGHKSSKTTEIYTHVSTDSLKNIKSPFDDL